MTNPTDPAAVARRRTEAGARGDRGRVAADSTGAAAVELEIACAEGIDLLVLGSRGYGPVMRVLLGSVSGHVFRHAPCPLLVARRP